MTGSGATYRAEIVYGGACAEVTWRVHSSEPIGDDKWSRMMAPVAHPRHCVVLMRVITETSSTSNHVSDCITVNAVRRSGSRGKCLFCCGIHDVTQLWSPSAVREQRNYTRCAKTWVTAGFCFGPICIAKIPESICTIFGSLRQHCVIINKPASRSSNLWVAPPGKSCRQSGFVLIKSKREHCCICLPTSLNACWYLAL